MVLAEVTLQYPKLQGKEWGKPKSILRKTEVVTSRKRKKTVSFASEVITYTFNALEQEKGNLRQDTIHLDLH